MKRRRRRGGRVENNSSPLRQPAAGKKSRCFLELAAIGTWKAARERERDKKQEGSGSNNSHFSTSLPFFLKNEQKGGKGRYLTIYIWFLHSFPFYSIVGGRSLQEREMIITLAKRVECYAAIWGKGVIIKLHLMWTRHTTLLVGSLSL